MAYVLGFVTVVTFAEVVALVDIAVAVSVDFIAPVPVAILGESVVKAMNTGGVAFRTAARTKRRGGYWQQHHNINCN